MRRHKIPGTALGILAGDREEHATFGVASVSSLQPVTPDTLFQIGSLSKTYTASVIWRLIDERALALDAPVHTFLPDLRLSDAATAASVTVANLLDHSAGWYGDEGFDTGSGDDARPRAAALHGQELVHSGCRRPAGDHAQRRYPWPARRVPRGPRAQLRLHPAQ